MSQHPFYGFFVDQLRELYDAESQIIENLPKVIQASSNEELKEALASHLDETKNHVQRLKKIFKMINENPTGITCKPITALFQDGEAWIKKKEPHAVRDAGIIVCCQKVEHFEISSYGSVRALARHLNDAEREDRIDFDEIADILQQSLDEESGADEKLTDLAEGGFFTQGINEEAQKEDETRLKKR
jgi:ferritin-like metal-binding protein YciE